MFNNTVPYTFSGVPQQASLLYYPGYIKIGAQWWTASNLSITSTLMDNPIPVVTVNATWATSQTLYDNAYSAESGSVNEKIYAGLKAAAMCCNYGNNESTGAIYGKMYNWFAAALISADINIYNEANPTNQYIGVVPVKTDLEDLVAYLGGAATAGGKLKEEGTAHWASPNFGAINSYGMTIMGDGRRNVDGTFTALTLVSGSWTSDKWKLELGNSTAYASIADRTTFVMQGFGIRLKKK